MKAIILDYTDGTILVVAIPKEWEESPSEFVESLPMYDTNQMYHMISNDYNVEVYNVVEDGKDADGYPCYDYQHITNL